jgi:hypothetical protein
MDRTSVAFTEVRIQTEVQDWTAAALAWPTISWLFLKPCYQDSVERLFSKSHHLCTDQRSTLKTKTLTEVMCTKVWLRESYEVGLSFLEVQTRSFEVLIYIAFSVFIWRFTFIYDFPGPRKPKLNSWSPRYLYT